MSNGTGQSESPSGRRWTSLPAARLQAGRLEIEQTVLARVYSVSDPAEVEDPEYVLGLKEAVGAALDYAMAGIEAGDREHLPVPDQLLAQARAAARNGVPADTVLRRYSGGYSLLADFLIRAAEGAEPIPSAELKHALRSLSAVFDRLVASISGEYARESKRHPRTPDRRRAERVGMLLAGEPVDPAELRYDFDGWHLATIASGPGAGEALRELVAPLDCSCLLVHPEQGTAWAWLGASSKLDARDTLRFAQRGLPAGIAIAGGEPGEGIGGWRLSHRQARAALAVAQRGPERWAHYADVALLAAILQDDLLATSLHQLYLQPLEEERDGGEAARETLRAYFAADRQATSAAAALGVDRHTVSNRLRAVEDRIGRSLNAGAAEIEAALRLRDLGYRSPPGSLGPDGAPANRIGRAAGSGPPRD